MTLGFVLDAVSSLIFVSVGKPVVLCGYITCNIICVNENNYELYELFMSRITLWPGTGVNSFNRATSPLSLFLRLERIVKVS